MVKNLLILFSIVISVLIIWIPDIFTLQDIPDHIARSYLLFHPSDNFFITHFPVPYILPDILCGLLLIFFNPILTIKIFTSITVLIFLLGSFKFIQKVKPNNPELLLLAPLILISNIFLKGNLNFLFATGLLFFSISSFNSSNIIKNIFLGILLYFSHLVGFLIWLLYLLINIPKNFKGFIQLSPSILLIAFMFWNGNNYQEPSISFITLLNPLNIFQKLNAFQILFNISSPYDFLTVLIPFSIILISIIKYKKNSKEFYFIAALSFLYLIVPDSLGSLIRPSERIFLILFIFSIITLNYSKSYLKVIVGITLMFFIIIRCYTFNEILTTYPYNPQLKEHYKMIQYIPKNSNVKVIFNKYYSSQFLHFDKLIITQGSFVDNLFTNKHLCIRYKKPIKDFQYLIVYGEKINDNRLKLLWEFRNQFLYMIIN